MNHLLFCIMLFITICTAPCTANTVTFSRAFNPFRAITWTVEIPGQTPLKGIRKFFADFNKQPTDAISLLINQTEVDYTKPLNTYPQNVNIQVTQKNSIPNFPSQGSPFKTPRDTDTPQDIKQEMIGLPDKIADLEKQKKALETRLTELEIIYGAQQ